MAERYAQPLRDSETFDRAHASYHTAVVCPD